MAGQGAALSMRFVSAWGPSGRLAAKLDCRRGGGAKKGTWPGNAGRVSDSHAWADPGPHPRRRTPPAPGVSGCRRLRWLVCGGTAMSPALFEVTAASLPLRWIPLLLASLLLLGLALACWAWVRRARLRRQVPARLAPRLRHPIVLAHGVFGFDEIVFAGRRHRYF